MQENISIPAFLATLSLDQLESVSIRAKEKANEIRMGERVTLWRVGTPHTNEYITENVERAIIYMRIQLDSFVKEKRFKLQISDFSVYKAEAYDYLNVYRRENELIDEYIEKEKT